MNSIFKQPSPKLQRVARIYWGVLALLAIISQRTTIDPTSSFAEFLNFFKNELSYPILFIAIIILIEPNLEETDFFLLYAQQIYKFKLLMLGILILLGMHNYLGALQPYFYIILLIAGIKLVSWGLQSIQRK